MRGARVALAVIVLAMGLGFQPAGASRRAEQLPNLVALAPFDIEIGEADSESPSDVPLPAIRFATGAANRSDYALELAGVPTGPDEAIAQQCVAWAAPRTCTAREDVGTFEWHPDHGHYHFQGFALYELRKLKRDGAPNMRKKGLVRTSGKVSYCIIDYEEDDPERDPIYTAPYPLYYSCLAGLSMQGISPGWKDVYTSGTTGQQIPLEGIPDGTYALIVHIDPDDALHELDEKDNSALVRLELSGNGTTLEVLCAQEPGDEECLPTATPEV